MNSLNDNNDDLNISSSEYNNRNKLEGQFEVLGSNSFYDIIAPKTFEAERYFGGNTEWCTVANNSYFSRYMEQGQLYILYPKNGNSEYKMQFHFESNSFADKTDWGYNNPIECINFTAEDESTCNELIALCKKVFGKNVKYRKHFLSPEEILEFIQIELKNGVNPEELFNEVGDFYDEGLARVYIENVGYNFINTKGEILRPDLWFDIAYPFSIKGLAVVYIKGRGYNFIKPDGKILSPKLWFDKVLYFYNGFVVVYKDDYKYKLDTNGILYDMNGNKVDIPLQESKKYNNKKRRFN